MEYSLFCNYNEFRSNPTEFLDRIVKGKFTVVMPQFAFWQADNTLKVLWTQAERDGFIARVKAASPGIKVVVWIASYTNMPNLSTAALRQKCVDQVVAFAKSSDYDGVLDDTEKWVGTQVNQYEYFSLCYDAVEGLGLEYWPWTDAWHMQMPEVAGIQLRKVAVGGYNGHTWTVDKWSSWFDWTLSVASGDVMFTLMAEHNSGYLTLAQQLPLLDKVMESSNAFYKVRCIGVYRYQSMTVEDWAAWYSWVSSVTPPPPMFVCSVCGLGFDSQEALNDHLGSHGVAPPKPYGGMWVATECGLDQVSIDKLRGIGHAYLPQPLIDWYHTDGKDVAEFLRVHPVSKRWVKNFLEFFFSSSS